ncbi:MAG: hypothetical protein EBU75_12235, partial [Betaproteobacteria bacterium]|nr:hypothetical protein [Betaproteobacteria bacterium]
MNLSGPSSTGGTTAYGAATVTLGATVSAVNDAPVLALEGQTPRDKARLAEVAEDTTAPAGETVAILFGPNFSDEADSVASGSSANTLAGVVITGYTADARGQWEYATGASNWTALPNAADATAFALAASTKVRFVPAANFNGAAPALTARLVDSSVAFVAGAVNLSGPSSTGGTTAYGAATVTLGTTVSAVNDTPVLDTVSGASYNDTLSDDPSFAAITGKLTGSDRDAGDQVRFELQGSSTVTVSGGSGFDLEKSSTYGTFYLNSTTGDYKFVPNDAAIEALKTTATVGFVVNATDGSGADSAPQTITLTLNGTNDAPTLTGIDTIAGGTEDTFKEITYADLAAAADEADVDSATLSFRVEAVSSGTTLQKWNASLNSSAGGWEQVVTGTTLIGSGDKVQWRGAQDANGVLNAFT